MEQFGKSILSDKSQEFPQSFAKFVNDDVQFHQIVYE